MDALSVVGRLKPTPSESTLSTEVDQLLSTLLTELQTVLPDDDPFSQDFICPWEDNSGSLFTDTRTYLDKVKALKHHFHTVTACVTGVESEGFVQRHASFYDWLCVDRGACTSLLVDSRATDAGVTYGSLLRICCVLERSLRNLLTVRCGSCPMMLKDIIKHGAVRDSFGDSVVALLDVLVGPPTSLNVRNLVWHGFGTEREDLGRLSRYMFWVLGLLGSRLKSGGIEMGPCPSFQILEPELVPIKRIHPELFISERTDPTRITLAGGKKYQMDRAVELAGQSKFGEALALLLTAFEHTMRVLYCQTNELPGRHITAVSSEHFITLDHAFEELLPDGAPNQLHEILPERTRTAVSDLLLYPSGLRLRDRLSHMELSYLDIGEDVWTFSVNVIGSLLASLRGRAEPSDTSDYISSSYVPIHHPVSELLRKVTALHDALEQLAIDKPTEWDRVNSCGEQATRLHPLLSYFKATRTARVPTLDLFSGSRKLNVSSEFGEVREWCKACEFIVDNLLQSVSAVEAFSESRYAMYSCKELRSRQRKNYEQFLLEVPYLLDTIKALYSVVVGHIDMMPSERCSVTKSEKLLIQLAENLNKFIQQNKWSWCVQYVDEFLNKNFVT